MKTNNYIKIRDELEYFWLWSAGGIGFVSNFGSMVNACFSGGPNHSNVNTDPYNEGVLRSISVRRQIEKKLRALPTHYLNILFSTFYRINFPISITNFFAQYQGAAIHTTLLTPKELHQYCDQFYLKKLSPPKLETLQSIKRQAQVDYEAALNAYANQGDLQ